MKARLRELYDSGVVPKIMEKYKFTSRMQVPRLEKIVLNVGMGKAIENAKLSDAIAVEIAAITGQRPVVTRAKKSISNFKIKEGMPVGCKATLRGERMYEFLDRLINAALPRIRDFKGVPVKSFDSSANYTIGLKEQTIFPEVDVDTVEQVHGMDVTIVTNSGNANHVKDVLELLGMPFGKA